MNADKARATKNVPAILLYQDPVEDARERGYYDSILGFPDKRTEEIENLELSYQIGWEMGLPLRERLYGVPYWEVRKSMVGTRCAWEIYLEGDFRGGGNSSSEQFADQQINKVLADLLQSHGAYRDIPDDDDDGDGEDFSNPQM